jgi:hypothetical protein
VPEDLERLAELIRAKNEADLAIAQLIGRPCERGNIGEFVAAKIFAIQLMPSGSHPGHDGVFQDAPLAGKTVNVKTYSRHESVLDQNKLSGIAPGPGNSRDSSGPAVLACGCGNRGMRNCRDSNPRHSVRDLLHLALTAQSKGQANG